MPTKPSILVLANFYLPGYLAGGPIRSIVNLVEGLSEEFDWKILTSDHDLGVREPYAEVRHDAWNRVGKAEVFYASARNRRPSSLLGIIRRTPHDILYLNSFFDPAFGILPALASRLGALSKPLVVAPRGEFSPGAIGLKAWKKIPYCRFADFTGVYRQALWHASTELEAADIGRALHVRPGSVHIASDLPTPLPPAPPPIEEKVGRPLRLCFLSRISRKKNLDYALRVLARVQNAVEFTIYGPQEDPAYWAECEGLIRALPPHARAVYAGPVRAEDVPAAFAGHDLFFFPTRGENFGHVFLEAWSAGVPVLTSDQTPWRGLDEKGVGMDLSLDDESAFVRAVEAAAAQSVSERMEIRARCLDFARAQAENPDLLEANRRLFAHAARLGEGK